MACFERFDFALLSLYTIDQLAKPFWTTNPQPLVWFAYADGVGCVGRITESGEMYETHKVQFIPAPVIAEEPNHG